VTLDRAAWDELAQMAAACDLERWGFLCGRRTLRRPECFRIVRVALGPVVKQTTGSIHINGPAALRAELALVKKDPGHPPVGAWHTHPKRARTADALTPQLSETDKTSILNGSFELICVTYPRPSDEVLRGNRFLIVTEIDGKVVRAEAWFRRGGRFLPCEIKVR
jgi:hypothetical protein